VGGFNSSVGLFSSFKRINQYLETVLSIIYIFLALFAEQTMMISLKRINKLICVIGKHCVFCEMRNDS
jgi:hypothetical protein